MKTDTNTEAGSDCPAATCSALPPVLDACCSVRAFWFDKNDDRAVYVDKRKEVITRKDSGTPKGSRELVINPDYQADFGDLPFPNNSFFHVVFDPPHKKREEYKGGFLVQQYGILNGDWKGMIKRGFAECFRVLKPGGTLIFKWCELEIPLREILALTPEKPLYGHRRKDHPMGTHWVAFIKDSYKESPEDIIAEALEDLRDGESGHAEKTLLRFLQQNNSSANGC